MHASERGEEELDRHVFSTGDINARIGQNEMRIQNWLQILKSSVNGRLQALVDEFFENVGSKIASVCILDL